MFAKFEKRSNKLERLDTGDYTANEYARWQREMVYIHRFFGEERALRKSLISTIRSCRRNEVSILDVGAGSGGLLSTVGQWISERKPFLLGTDLNPEASETMRLRGLKTIRCDSFQLPFSDNSFDFVISSLFLHHLTDENAVKLLIEMSRVARDRIIVIDLHRSPIAYYVYRVLGWFLLQRFTHDDGSLSILRSFKPRELNRLAKLAGLEEITIRRSAAYRLILSGK